MRSVIAKDFMSVKNELGEAIAGFSSTGDFVFRGNRNTIKEFKIQGQRFVIKSFKIPNPVNKIAYRFFRKSKAERSYLYANKLLKEGIGTPVPVGFYENRLLFSLQQSYYISLFQESNLTFRDLLKLPDGEEKTEILRQFTAFTKKLHDKGILFLDHSPGNTLIKKSRNGQYEFYLVDLNRMRFRPLNYEDRIKNFNRLTGNNNDLSVMADAYAVLIKKDKDRVFRDMRSATELYHRKKMQQKKLKRKFLFWVERYKKQ